MKTVTVDALLKRNTSVHMHRTVLINMSAVAVISVTIIMVLR